LVYEGSETKVFGKGKIEAVASGSRRVKEWRVEEKSTARRRATTSTENRNSKKWKTKARDSGTSGPGVQPFVVQGKRCWTLEGSALQGGRHRKNGWGVEKFRVQGAERADV
jgi:hypothetical protein